MGNKLQDSLGIMPTHHISLVENFFDWSYTYNFNPISILLYRASRMEGRLNIIELCHEYWLGMLTNLIYER